MKVVTIGRNNSNDIVIKDPRVSGYHLQIIQGDDGRFRVADFGSLNGTFVNGNRIKGESFLSLTDVIRIGETILPWTSYFKEQCSPVLPDTSNLHKTVTIGRAADNDVICGNRAVSHHHAQIHYYKNGLVSIVDLNSTNGTFVNGKQIKGERFLNRGDQVEICFQKIIWEKYRKNNVLWVSIGAAAVAIVAVAIALLCFFIRYDSDQFSENETVYYSGQYSASEYLTVSMNGCYYSVLAVPGQILVYFNDDISYFDCKKIIRKNGGKVVAQDPDNRYFLVEVDKGKESVVYNTFTSNSMVRFTSLNEILQSSSVYVLDNFAGSHGNQVLNSVKQSFHSYDVNVEYSDISYNDDRYMNTEMLNEGIIKKLKNNDSPVVINLSMGPSFDDIVKNTPLFDRLDPDNLRQDYLFAYNNSLKNLVEVVAPYKDRDFVIVKAAGNDAAELDVILNEFEDQLSTDNLKIFKEHFLLVSAVDKKSPDNYSNNVKTYSEYVTSVDISDLPWKGTSFAAPRVAAWLDELSKDKDISLTDALTLVKSTTKKNFGKPILYQDLKKETNNDNQYQQSNIQEDNDAFVLDLTREYNGEYKFSIGNKKGTIKYEAHNTYGANYLSGNCDAFVFSNESNYDVKCYFEVIEADVFCNPSFIEKRTNGAGYYFRSDDINGDEIKRISVQMVFVTVTIL